MTEQISTIILAAGASTRMQGTVKQLLTWGKTTLLGNAIEQVKPVSSQVYVVWEQMPATYQNQWR